MRGMHEILSLFNGTRKTGESQWQCKCPVHGDKTASLGIAFKDGRILINCFAGCSLESILKSVGLKFDDIMPEKNLGHHKPERHLWNPYSVLKSIRDDVGFVYMCAHHMAKGKRLLDSDYEKLKKITPELRGAYDKCK